MRVLLLTPPMVQLNTPYPATAYLTGFLRKHAPDVTVTQTDPAQFARSQETGLAEVVAPDCVALLGFAKSFGGQHLHFAR